MSGWVEYSAAKWVGTLENGLSTAEQQSEISVRQIGSS